MKAYNMATWTVWRYVVPFARVHIVLGARSTELVLATRPNRFLGRLIANVADENILSNLGMLLEKQVGVIGDLTHLHDESKDVRIVVEHDAARNISVKSTSRIGHDAR